MPTQDTRESDRLKFMDYKINQRVCYQSWRNLYCEPMRRMHKAAGPECRYHVRDGKPTPTANECPMFDLVDEA